tara:strand:+ start:91 stop:891 length:801 start_codon:yes stop_codon:yes gene_type:complete
MKIRHFHFIFLFCFAANVVQAQYWMGFKAGPSFITHDYRYQTYTDSFNIDNGYNFHLGLIMTYVASKRFAVTTELNYERRSRTLSSVPNIVDSASSIFNTHYLTSPILLQVNFPGSPQSFYVSAGIKLNYWLAGTGTMYTTDIGNNTGGAAIDYTIVFNESNPSQNQKSIVDANRLQYGLSAGAGFYLDVFRGDRMLFDFRYNFTHSNLGFNGVSSDFENMLSYYENFEYRNHSITVSVGYLLYYDSQLKRKGSSSIKGKKSKKRK